MISNNEEMSEISFSDLDESVLELMNWCVQNSENQEKAHDDVEDEVENTSSVKDEVSERIATLEALIEIKEQNIKEYEEEVRLMRARVHLLNQAKNVDHEDTVSENVEGKGPEEEGNPTELNPAEERKRMKCFFFEQRGFCRFGNICYDFHPSSLCDSWSSRGFCPLGKGCSSLHPQRDCKYWLNGYFLKSSQKCGFKHDPRKRPRGGTNINNNTSSEGNEYESSNHFLDESMMRKITTGINTAINRWKLSMIPPPILHQTQIPQLPTVMNQYLSEKPPWTHL